MLTKSRYAIISKEQYRDAEGRRCRLVYHTGTGRVSVLGRAAADALRDGDLDALPGPLTAHLRELEVLTDRTPEQERLEVVAHQRAKSDSRESRVFVLVPTAYCNMGCDYCGQTHRKAPLTGDHRGRVGERVMAAMRQPETSHVQVRWFGGEPMMAFAVLRSMSATFVEEAERTGCLYSATLTTNGTLLTMRKLRQLHHEYAVGEVCITLDGPEEVHDTHRPLKSGLPSYRRILAFLKELRAAADEFPKLSMILRVNVDARNRHTVPRLLEELAAAGMDHPMFRLELHGVYAWSNDVSGIRLGPDELAEDEVGWIRHAVELGLDHAVLPRARAGRICPAVSRSEEVLSSTGNVFSCTEHPLVDEHERNDAVSTVVALPTPTLRPAGRYDNWHDRLAAAELPCGNCELLPVCGGSCPKHWEEGDPPCPPLKRNTQQRMDLVAHLNGLTPAGAALEPVA